MRKPICLIIAGLCLALSACGGASSSETQSAPPVIPGSSVEEPVLPIEEESEIEIDLSPGIPEGAQDVLRELRSLEPEGIVIADEAVDLSGGSLTATADDELIELIIDIISVERPRLLPQGIGYPEFISIRPAEAGLWSVYIGRMEGEQDAILRLQDSSGEESDSYIVDAGDFEALHQAVSQRTIMLEAPVDEFLAPVQIVVAHYRSGSYDAEEYASVYEQPPQGSIIPAVNSTEDFTVTPGSGLSPYNVIFPIQGVRYNMVLSMIQVYPSADKEQIPTWRVMTVTFEPS